MRPHDGLLIVALLIVAIAAGCDRREEARAKPAPTAAKVDDSGAATNADPAAPGVSDARAAPATPDAPATAELKRAREELNDLAEGALSLRAALLGAKFEQDAAAPQEGQKPASPEAGQ